jgi:pumilio RNA-binding family
VIQIALDCTSAADKEILVAELHGSVRLAISSPHANFVIQKTIEVMPIDSAAFVPLELATFAAEVARHRFGCRVLSRLVEHHLCGTGAAASTNVIIDELLLEAGQLIQHNFARHVLELILEHGTEVHKRRISDVIRKNVYHCARNRFASYVVEKALSLCRAEDVAAIASELMRDAERFLTLAVHECGMHVVKAVLRLRGSCAEKALRLLMANVDQLKSSKHGQRLLDEM